MAIKNVFLTTERKIAVVVYRFLPIGVENNQLPYNKSLKGNPVIFGTPKTGLQYSGVNFNSEVELRQQGNLVGNPEAELQGILKANKKTGIKRNFSKLKRERVGSLNVLINFLNPISKQDTTNTSKFNIQVVLELGTKLLPKTKVYYYS